ncbi:MAG TPA: cation transporter, partial [Burkholderiales bacterium]|nr:cation transporter [Burkholderiales bacterium]
WMALAVNTAMFAVEVVASLHAASVSLFADSADFLGDAGNYVISLIVLPLGLAWRARAALVKGLSMAVFGVIVIASALISALTGRTPEAITMGWVGALAIAANLGVAMLLYRYRDGDADMRSVWLCTRNDVLGNMAVLVAALGVFGTGTHWPDVAVASIMGVLAATAAWTVIHAARLELRSPADRFQVDAERRC